MCWVGLGRIDLYARVCMCFMLASTMLSAFFFVRRWVAGQGGQTHSERNHRITAERTRRDATQRNGGGNATDSHTHTRKPENLEIDNLIWRLIRRKRGTRWLLLRVDDVTDNTADVFW